MAYKCARCNAMHRGPCPWAEARIVELEKLLKDKEVADAPVVDDAPVEPVEYSNPTDPADDEEEARSGNVMIWGGNNLNMLRKFVAPHKVSQQGLVACIEGVENAELLPPGTRIINEDGLISVDGPTSTKELD